MPEFIQAEVKLDYQGFEVGVNKTVAASDRLEKGVDANFGRMYDSVKGSLDGINTSLKALSLERIGNQLKTVGEVGGNLFKGSVGGAASFQTEMLRVQTIANLSEKQLAEFSEQIRTVGRDLGIGVKPAEAAAGAYELLSSGFTKTADTQTVLTAVLKAASAGNADAAATSKLLAGSLNAYGASADQAGRFSDVLFQTVNAGVTTIPELAQSLGLVTSVAANGGVKFEELGAAIATTTLKGQNTSSSIEGLRGVISALLDPTTDARKELAALGITVNANTLRQKGLLATLVEINSAAGGNVASIGKIVGSQQALVTTLNLVNDGGARFRDNLKLISNSAGSTDKALKTVQSGFEAQQKALDASVESLKVSFGTVALPLLTKGVQFTSSLVTAFDAVPEPVKLAALAFTGLAGALTAVGGAVIATNAVFGPFIAQVIGFATTVGPLSVTQAIKMAAGYREAAKTAAAAKLAADSAAIGLTSGLGGATKSAGLLAGAFSPLGLAIIGVTGLVAAGTAALTEYTNAQTRATEASIQQAEVLNGKVGAAFSAGNIVAGNAKDLVDKGINIDAIDERIAQLRAKLQAALNGPDQDVAKKLKEDVLALIQRKNEVLQEIANRQNGQKFGQIQDPRAASVAKEEEEKAHKQAFENELSRIKLSHDGFEKKLIDLKALAAFEQQGTELRRRADQAIFDEEKKRDADRLKRAKDRIKDQVQKVENSGKGENDQILDLRKIQAKNKSLLQADHDLNRTLEDKIFNLKQQHAKKEEETIKRLSELRKHALETQASQAQRDLADLERASNRGAQNGAAQAGVIIKQGAIEKGKIQEQLNTDLAKEKDPEVIKQKKQVAKDAQSGVDAETKQRLRDLGDRDTQQRADQQTELLRTEQEIGQTRIDLLKEQLSTGIDVQDKLKRAVLDRLALQEQEIRVQAELAKQQTDDPIRAQQAETLAQAQIAAARRAANQEIQAGTKAWEEQKRARDAALGKEFSGGIQSIQDAFQSVSDQFGIDAVHARQDQIRASNRGVSVDSGQFGAPKPFGLDTKQLDGALLSRSALTPGQINKQFSDGQRELAKINVGGTVNLALTLRDGKGRQMDFDVDSITTDGRNSPLQFMAERMNFRR